MFFGSNVINVSVLKSIEESFAFFLQSGNPLLIDEFTQFITDRFLFISIIFAFFFPDISILFYLSSFILIDFA